MGETLHDQLFQAQLNDWTELRTNLKKRIIESKLTGEQLLALVQAFDIVTKGEKETMRDIEENYLDSLASE